MYKLINGERLDVSRIGLLRNYFEAYPEETEFILDTELTVPNIMECLRFYSTYDRRTAQEIKDVPQFLRSFEN